MFEAKQELLEFLKEAFYYPHPHNDQFSEYLHIGVNLLNEGVSLSVVKDTFTRLVCSNVDGAVKPADTFDLCACIWHGDDPD